MPFIPHTAEDTTAMLSAIGVDNLQALFDEIPDNLRCQSLKLDDGLSEIEIGRLMRQRAQEDGQTLNFAGAGAYEHHIPAVVWEIATRGEFYSAYTPYQAEASQGTLQLLYEYQSMMTQLTSMDVSNASLYDGASALAEAVLMAVRANRKSKSKTILVPSSLHPHYRQVVETLVSKQNIRLLDIAYDPERGITDMAALSAHQGEDITAIVIPQPNFFGALEPVDDLVTWAHAQKALSIAVVNPVAIALLKPPGHWGGTGADITCGEGQPLGIPLASGGPYLGFLCCRQALVRQMPGRIIGRTVDLDGRPGYTLTLQAREQHIRRSKATSNICTNQGLLVTAATIHMAVMGAQGLASVATQSHQNTQALVKAMLSIPGVERVFNGPFFHEVAIKLPKSVSNFLRSMGAHNILAGVALDTWYPELSDTLLVCATETKTADDIERYRGHMQRMFAAPIACQLTPKG